jgi:Protein of unknown function (DUF559)
LDDALHKLAATQLDLVAYWQLIDAGWSPRMIEHHAVRGRWQTVHLGVYAMTRAPLSREQRWMAATLTTPDSFLSFGSAGARYGIFRFNRPFEVVTRPGNGGPRRSGALLVYRSGTLHGDRVIHRGMRMTTPERTVVDVAAGIHEKAARRVIREALRLKLTNPLRLVAAATKHQNRRNSSLIAQLAARYATLPYDRTRSDAEAWALELLHDAGIPQPLVNATIAGEEADLTWPDRHLIIEIDGPQFHRFKDEDARKQAIWERAGFTVRRIPSDDVYGDPAKLVLLYSRIRPST